MSGRRTATASAAPAQESAIPSTEAEEALAKSSVAAHTTAHESTNQDQLVELIVRRRAELVFRPIDGWGNNVQHPGWVHRRTRTAASLALHTKQRAAVTTRRSISHGTAQPARIARAPAP